ncbi:maltokinase N-terminal cap-like domain-containing protein [Serinicoccus marinus]|uniref:maltokinase N-terminal cap-like domain-containing protein n=1 Tax=Serinicoccus marinus TaxID=247333 RepID=UPI001EE7926C|nr:aminoglycoside phosphotransferase [Serinicoccus marinus]
MATLTPTFEDFLPAWVARQRWYRGKRAGAPALRRVSSIRWQDPFGEVGIDDHLLVDESGPEPVVYQVPLTYRAEAVPFLEHALVATAEHSELGTRYIYDATHDPVFADVLLREMYAEHEVPAARARRLAPEGPVPALASSRVLTGEQSNTSIIVDMHGEDLPVIIKLFRVLAEGDNPDVSVQTAVSRGGSRQVPDPVGSIEGRWVAPGGGEAHGHLAFAQEFLPGTEDAWRRALVAAGADRDFTESARSLGAATAAVHAVLRDAFGTRPAADRRSTLVAQMRTRAEQAFRDAPELSAYREPVLGVYAELESSDLPDLQRIHGDYHLGQVLDAPDRGWVLLDFEGEPLRPLAERTEPDLALRDVAGMLRSFDYAAASAAASGAGDRGAWATAARESFLDGYATGSGEDRREELTALLAALELDKALYEVSYEAQNRPDWVAIPVAAVRRLLGEPAADGRHRGAPTVPASPRGCGGRGSPHHRRDRRRSCSRHRHRPRRRCDEGDPREHERHAPCPHLGCHRRGHVRAGHPLCPARVGRTGCPLRAGRHRRRLRRLAHRGRAARRSALPPADRRPARGQRLRPGVGLGPGRERRLPARPHPPARGHGHRDGAPRPADR